MSSFASPVSGGLIGSHPTALDPMQRFVNAFDDHEIAEEVYDPGPGWVKGEIRGSNLPTHASVAEAHLRKSGERISQNLQKQIEKAREHELPEALLQQTQNSNKISKHPLWGRFKDAYDSVSGFWQRKLMSNTAGIASNTANTVANSLLMSFMAQQSAQAAMATTAPPPAGMDPAAAGAPPQPAGIDPSASAGPALPPGIRKLKLAAAAGILANGLTLLYSIPSTIFAVGSIVAAIKTGVDLHKQKNTLKATLEKVKNEIKELQQELVRETDPARIDELKGREKELIAQEHHLNQNIEAARQTSKQLPVKILIGGLKGTANAIKSVNSALNLVKIGLIASAHTVTTTAQTLSSVTSVLGPIALVISTGLGGFSIFAGGVQTIKVYKERSQLGRQIAALRVQLETEGSSPSKKLLEKEIARLENKQITLKDTQRNLMISFATNTAMTFAGVLGLAAAVGVVTGPGALVVSGFVIVIMAAAAGISTVHWLVKRSSDKKLIEKLAPQKMTSDEMQSLVEYVEENIQLMTDEEIAPYIPELRKKGLKTEEREMHISKFKKNPQSFLKTHFNMLLQQ